MTGSSRSQCDLVRSGHTEPSTIRLIANFVSGFDPSILIGIGIAIFSIIAASWIEVAVAGRSAGLFARSIIRPPLAFLGSILLEELVIKERSK